MEISSFTSIGASIAFALFVLDLLFEIRHILALKDSRDISIFGSLMRVTGVTLLLIRFINIGDIPLIIGQTVFATLLIVYVCIVFKYRNNKN